MNKQNLPLVFIPGFMLDESLWKETIQELPAKWQICTANLLTGNSIAEIARAIAEKAPAHFVLIGFSLGGYIARALVEQFPEKVAALILIATSLRPDTLETKQQKLAAIKATSQEYFRGLSSKAIAKTLHPLQMKNNTLIKRIQHMGENLGYAAFVNQSMLSRDDFQSARITCPTLIIAGAQDQIRSQTEATELYHHIPNANLQVIEDSGHMIPLEQPKALATAISQWLKKSALY